MIALASAIAFIKGSRLTQLALLVVFVALATLTISKCTGSNRKEVAQARQTTASGEAIANAAKDAVQTVSERSQADLAIDAAVAQAKKEIKDAKDPTAVRAAVIRSLCARPEYRLDPACSVQPANPR